MGCSASKATAVDAMEEQPVRPAPTEDSAHAHKPLDAGSASFAKHAVNQVEVRLQSCRGHVGAYLPANGIMHDAFAARTPRDHTLDWI